MDFYATNMRQKQETDMKVKSGDFLQFYNHRITLYLNNNY